jgi:hypothetical protein
LLQLTSRSVSEHNLAKVQDHRFTPDREPTCGKENVKRAGKGQGLEFVIYQSLAVLSKALSRDEPPSDPADPMAGQTLAQSL